MTTSFDHDQSPQTTASAEAADSDAPGTDPSEDSEARDASASEADPLADLRRERDEILERLLRTAAEFDNYRKRIDRERRDQADAAVASAIEELLPIADNLERALDAPAGSDEDVYRSGVELILKQMTDLLRKRGVTSIHTVGADFDPRFHEAVIQEVSAEHREGEVMEELSRGYMLGERLLRPAMVKVAKA